MSRLRAHQILLDAALDRNGELAEIAEQALRLVTYAYQTMVGPREMPPHVKEQWDRLADRLSLRERSADQGQEAVED